MFLGYFITYIMALNTFGAFFRFAGFLVMAYGAKKLSEYQTSFVWSIYAALPLALLSVVRIVSDFTLIIPIRFMDALTYVEVAAVLVYHVFLLVAIWKIAKETDVEKIQSRAITALVFIMNIPKHIVSCFALSGNVLYPSINTHITAKTFGRI